VTLKFHHLLGPKSPAHALMIEPWAKRVEEASGGKLKIEIYPSMSLGGKPPQLVRQVRDGVVDIIWTVLGYTPGLFPRSEVFELPFVHTNNAVATNLAMRDLYDQYLKEEFQDYKIIVLHVHAGQAIHMASAPVRTADDLTGKKMRIPTRTGAWILEALGANPVGMPVPDLPQALSKGVVDGALIPFEIVRPLKIQELTKFQTEGPNSLRFGTSTFMIAMNKEKYESLPDDLKAAIDKNSGEDFAREVGKIWTKSEEGGLAALKEAGNEIIVLPESEVEVFRERTAPVVDRWIKEVEEKGIPGKELVEAARAAIAKHAKETM
jgi:TRAP-type C4-dicarboxylate transport system substrate-binding protein